MVTERENRLRELFLSAAQQIADYLSITVSQIIGEDTKRGSRHRDISDARTILIVATLPHFSRKSELARMFWKKGMRSGDILYHLNKHEALISTNTKYIQTSNQIMRKLKF